MAEHDAIRDGLVWFLAHSEGITVLGDALVEPDTPDVIVVNTAEPPGSARARALSALRVRAPKARVLVVGADDDSLYAEWALNNGADGYITTERAPEHLLNAVQALSRGSRYVCPDLKTPASSTRPPQSSPRL